MKTGDTFTIPVDGHNAVGALVRETKLTDWLVAVWLDPSAVQATEPELLVFTVLSYHIRSGRFPRLKHQRQVDVARERFKVDRKHGMVVIDGDGVFVRACDDEDRRLLTTPRCISAAYLQRVVGGLVGSRPWEPGYEDFTYDSFVLRSAEFDS